MITKKIRLSILSISALAVLTISGCLLTSATFLITLLFPGPFLYNTTTNFDAVAVDLDDNQDWRDNKDDIERIESIRFGGVVTNNLGVADEVSLYISKTRYTTYAQLLAATDVYAVLSGMPVPASASPTTVTAEDTDPYLNRKRADLEKIRNLILFGQFFTYAAGGNANFDLLFENCVYHIAFTAAK
jgi:hypothetical protein